MKNVLVTGATGLIGSVICTQLVARGVRARTMARRFDSVEVEALRKAGVEVVPGDISDLKDVQAAAKGVDGIIHSAAMVGGPDANITDGFNSNVMGSIAIYTTAMAMGGIPVVEVITSTFFDMWEKPLTEHSPLDLMFRNADPYSITKRLGYVEGIARVQAGQDIRFMLPGGAFGPSVCVDRVMKRPSFNHRIGAAIRGELGEQVPLPVPYTFVGDCAFVCIAALEKGVKGERYIAMGRQQDLTTTAANCSRACEIAGVPHRITEVPRDKLSDPEVVAKYGPTVTTLAKRTYPTPFFDSSFTENRLGYVPTPLEEGLKITVDWMRRNKLI